MSRVISFRLDDRNPREARALAVLASQQERGISVRQVMVEALLGLEERTNADASELRSVLRELQALLSQVQSGQVVQVDAPEGDSQLLGSFVQSVRESARAGRSLG